MGWPSCSQRQRVVNPARVNPLGTEFWLHLEPFPTAETGVLMTDKKVLSETEICQNFITMAA
jgi:hypothetical protein